MAAHIIHTRSRLKTPHMYTAIRTTSTFKIHRILTSTKTFTQPLDQLEFSLQTKERMILISSLPEEKIDPSRIEIVGTSVNIHPGRKTTLVPAIPWQMKPLHLIVSFPFSTRLQPMMIHLQTIPNMAWTKTN